MSVAPGRERVVEPVATEASKGCACAFLVVPPLAAEEIELVRRGAGELMRDPVGVGMGVLSMEDEAVDGVRSWRRLGGIHFVLGACWDCEGGVGTAPGIRDEKSEYEA